MSDQNEQAQTESETDSQWLRVSPIAIVYFCVKTLFFLVNNVFLYMLPVLAFNFSSIRDNFLSFVLGAIGLVILVLLNSCIKYFFYHYRVGTDRVEIRQGMINKTHLDLPFAKIQNVKIIEPFYYRFSNYSILELDTAGSAQQEANIVAIRLPLAELLKRKVQSNVQNPTIEHSATISMPDDMNNRRSSSPVAEILLNHRNMKDLVIHGITNNRVWIFLAFLAPLYQTISENIGLALSYLGFDINAYLSIENQSILMLALHLLSIVMIVMLVIVMFSVLGSIFVFFDYKLWRHEERYIRRSGLFTRHEVSMQVSRIQRVVQQQDWLDILIGRVNLSFEQNSSGVANGNQAAQVNSTSKLLVPSITPLEADELTGDVFTIQQLSTVPYQSVSRRLILRIMLFPLLLILAIFPALIFSVPDKLLHTCIALGMTALFIGIATLRWYRWGFASDETFLYIRKGFFGKDYIAFPLAKVQQTRFVQTPFMRAKKLASLHVVLASGGMYVPYLQQHIVRSVIDTSLLIVERDKPAWM